MAKKTFDLGDLDWHVSGYNPYEWLLGASVETGVMAVAEVGPVSAPVPGSVQKALLDADLLPDWNLGLNARQCYMMWVDALSASAQKNTRKDGGNGITSESMVDFEMWSIAIVLGDETRALSDVSDD